MKSDQPKLTKYQQTKIVIKERLETLSFKVAFGIDGIKPYWLLLSAIGITFIFGCYYYVASGTLQRGLKETYNENSDVSTQISFGEACYFSVVTETTVGYGDLRPMGVTRAVVCGQVIIWLILAGVIVAKITSDKGKKLRLAVYNTEGYWIELFHHRKKNILLSFAYFDYENGELKYGGTNYDCDGNQEGSFKGKLLDMSNDILKFDYEGYEGNSLFDSGIQHLNFEKKGKKWECYLAKSFDYLNKDLTPYIGWRATKHDIAVFTNGTVNEKKQLIKKHIDKMEGELKQHLLKNGQDMSIDNEKIRSRRRVKQKFYADGAWRLRTMSYTKKGR